MTALEGMYHVNNSSLKTLVAGMLACVCFSVPASAQSQFFSPGGSSEMTRPNDQYRLPSGANRTNSYSEFQSQYRNSGLLPDSRYQGTREDFRYGGFTPGDGSISNRGQLTQTRNMRDAQGNLTRRADNGWSQGSNEMYSPGYRISRLPHNGEVIGKCADCTNPACDCPDGQCSCPAGKGSCAGGACAGGRCGIDGPGAQQGRGSHNGWNPGSRNTDSLTHRDLQSQQYVPVRSPYGF